MMRLIALVLAVAAGPGSAGAQALRVDAAEIGPGRAAAGAPPTGDWPAVDLIRRLSGDSAPLERYHRALRLRLHQLYYLLPEDQGPPPAARVREFQRDLDTAATGELTVNQFRDLLARAVRTTETPVYVPGQSTRISYSPDYASVQGTAAQPEGAGGHPVNLTRIFCRRQIAQCHLVQAYLIVPRVDDERPYYSLSMTDRSYEVISWSEQEIVSRTPSPCRSERLVLRPATGEVYEQIIYQPTAECELGALVPRVAEAHRTTLVPSFEYTRSYWEERARTTSAYRSERYRRLASQ